MDAPEKRALASALDAAIDFAAHETFVQASIGWNGSKKERELGQAYRDLHDSLSRLEMPDYRYPLVPAFYALWYQPLQINLAWASFRQIVQRRSGSLDNLSALRVVDFGCGALAVKFGLCLAALELAQDGRPFPPIQLDLVDDSDAMVAIGEQIWQSFVARLARQPDLYDRIPVVETRRLNGAADVPMDAGAECWLVALHAFYRQNQPAVASALKDLYAKYDPSLGLLTCHQGNAGLVQGVSPFPRRLRNLDLTALPLSGVLHNVTRRRQHWFREFNIRDSSSRGRGASDKVRWDPPRGLRDNMALAHLG